MRPMREARLTSLPDALAPGRASAISMLISPRVASASAGSDPGGAEQAPWPEVLTKVSETKIRPSEVSAMTCIGVGPFTRIVTSKKKPGCGVVRSKTAETGIGFSSSTTVTFATSVPSGATTWAARFARASSGVR